MHILGVRIKTAMLYDLVTLKISLIVFYAISFNRIRSHNFLMGEACSAATTQLALAPGRKEGGWMQAFMRGSSSTGKPRQISTNR